MSLRKKGDKTSQEASLLATLEPLLNMIFENCLERREYHNVIGVALQSERLDVIQKTLELADFNYALLGYLKLACLESNIKISFRNQVKFYFYFVLILL